MRGAFPAFDMIARLADRHHEITQQLARRRLEQPGVACSTASAFSATSALPIRRRRYGIFTIWLKTWACRRRALPWSLVKASVVVDNKPGTDSFIGAQTAAKARPDGYTVFIPTNTTQAASEHLFKKRPYDLVKDFAPVAALGRGGQIMVVNPGLPMKDVKDVKEFIALAKCRPGKRSFGRGSSSSRRLMCRRWKKRGVKGYKMTYWFAAYVPSGTPADGVARLNDILVKAAYSSGAAGFYQSTGTEIFTNTPVALGKFQTAESLKRGGASSRRRGITPA